MAKLHHMVLKAALAIYQPLFGTMPNEALKEAISADEKKFLPEEVDEIYQAIIANPLTEGQESKNNLDSKGGDDKSGNEDNVDHDDIDDTGDNKVPVVSNDKKSDAYIVATEFRDINNFSRVYRKGQNVSHLPKERLEKLVTLKHVVIV